MRSIKVYLVYFSLIFYVNCTEDPRIIIIGAGAAGISAATKLYQNGLKNFVILEAQNRIGGRIYSVKFGESYIDLGAQWCHGVKNNLVYSIVKDLDIFETEDLSPKMYHSYFKQVDEEFSEKLIDLYIKTFTSATKLDPYNIVGDVLEDLFNKEVSATWKSEKERKIGYDSLEVFHKSVLSEVGAPSWFNISIKNEYEVCEGEQYLSWHGMGYKTILDVLMGTFPDSKNEIPIRQNILLNKEVVNVRWNNSSPVVTCTDGTTYIGDHVIFTSSVGVLQDHQSLFVPKLPQEKTTAISSLGMGAVGKVFVYYNNNNKWWNDNFKGVTFVWEKEQLEKSAKLFPEGPTKGTKSWITSILEMLPVLGVPNVYSVWYLGEFVPEIENAPNEIIANGITFLLNRFLGNDYTNITQPDNIIWHKWYVDPHFRGTYSFNTPEGIKQKVSPRVVLSKPVTFNNTKPVLQFAGEATSLTHYGCVHGAIESGFREANRLIDYYKS